MDPNILYLSWLNGDVKAVAAQREGPPATHGARMPVDNLAGFGAFVRTAIQQTHFRGANAVLVLAHPRLSHQLLEVPPVQGWALERYLQRQLARVKTFEAEAAWASQLTLPTKTAKGLLLHLFPKPFLDQMIAGCEAAGLRLIKVLPVTDILAAQLAQLPVEAGHTALLAAETSGTTTVVVGRKDGTILLGRSLNSDWNLQAGRLGVDLNRTMLFVKQQFGVPVESVWLFGEGGAKHIPELQPMVTLPINISPVAHPPFYWASEAGKIREIHNLISSEFLRAPKERLLLKLAALLVALLVFGSLLTAGVVEVIARNQQQALAQMEPRRAQLEARRAELEKWQAELGEKSGFIEALAERRPEPVPAWFLAYMGEVMPRELLVRSFRVRRENHLWLVRISGTLQDAEVTTDESLKTVTAALTENLQNGPFHMQLTNTVWPTVGAAPDPRTGTAGRVVQTARAAADRVATRDPHQFVIEGVMR